LEESVEKQLYTRNALTGGMMILAFVLIWLPSPCAENLRMASEWIDQQHSAILAGLIAVIVSTPFIGFIIGTIVMALRYAFLGHPYGSDEVRVKFKQIVREKIRDGRYSAIGELIENMEPDDVFVFFFYSNAPLEIIEWARRRRTTQYLGYFWTASILIGATLAFVLDPQLPISKLLSAAGLSIFCVVALLMSGRAKKEAEEVEHLWYETFLDQRLLEWFPAKSE
jgi:hypothetical protein